MLRAAILSVVLAATVAGAARACPTDGPPRAPDVLLVVHGTSAPPIARDVLAHSGFGTDDDRGARTATVEAVASDGYRAVFSWGELFNSGVGEQTLVIVAQDERPLDAVAGPLDLRPLADLRPGPRHVRNLCSLLVKR